VGWYEDVTHLGEAQERLDSLLLDHEPEFAATLNPPASDGELDVLRAAIEPYELIEELEMLYRWHNGQHFAGSWPLLQAGPLLDAVAAAEKTRRMVEAEHEPWQWSTGWVAITHSSWQQTAVQLVEPLQGMVIDASFPGPPRPRADSLAAIVQSICILIDDGISLEPPAAYGEAFVEWGESAWRALAPVSAQIPYLSWLIPRWNESTGDGSTQP
jgi:hypothetical protein